MSAHDGVLRRTGRTTRMLDEALRLLAEGIDGVWIVGHNLEACRLMERELDRMAKAVGVHLGRRVGFTSASSQRLDWERRYVQGSIWPVLFDHVALEEKMGWMFDEWSRWSLEPRS